MTVSQRGRGRSGRGRLTRSAEFERIYREGRSRANRFLVMYVFERGNRALAGDSHRLGVSVNRRVGGAVERARVKRLLREAFWELAESIPAGYDVVLVARPALRELADRGGKVGVQGAVLELVSQVGFGKEEEHVG